MNPSANPIHDLAERLIATWAQQGREGFLLSALESAEIETREQDDPDCGVRWRFRWMPHREIRGDVTELQNRGILNPDRDETKLFRDPRDPKGRHCFLCPRNIAECHPMERLAPMNLAGRDYLAGANFAWIEPNHFTVMDAEHVDQAYSRHALDAAIDFHRQTDGRFRVLFNGPDAGASIPWHMHFQVTTAAMPIETMDPARQDQYPTPVQRFPASNDSGIDRAHAYAGEWIALDPQHHTVNLLVTRIDGGSGVFIFPRDKRRATAEGKGLVGGFEVSGDFVLSAPDEREVFLNSDAATARGILEQVHPLSDSATE